MRRPADGSPRAGVTLVEGLIALVLIGLLFAKAALLFRMTDAWSGSQAAAIDLEDQARRQLDRIAYAIIGAERQTLLPASAAPLSSSALTYRVSTGVQNGNVVWTDPERVGLFGGPSELVWAENPGAANERRVVWNRYVRPLLEGEQPNGIDDNGNGLVDESGVAFVLDGNSVTIQVTLERVDERGEVHTSTVETTVTCRNRF